MITDVSLYYTPFPGAASYVCYGMYTEGSAAIVQDFMNIFATNNSCVSSPIGYISSYNPNDHQNYLEQMIVSSGKRTVAVWPRDLNMTGVWQLNINGALQSSAMSNTAVKSSDVITWALKPS